MPEDDCQRLHPCYRTKGENKMISNRSMSKPLDTDKRAGPCFFITCFSVCKKTGATEAQTSSCCLAVDKYLHLAGAVVFKISDHDKRLSLRTSEDDCHLGEIEADGGRWNLCLSCVCMIAPHNTSCWILIVADDAF
jgi:hypothetical protein